MNRSESIVNLSKALFVFQSKIDNVSKDAVNPFFKSKYASLTSILEGIKHPLVESLLIIMQNPGSDDNGAVTLNTIIMHAETAEYIESSFSMKPVKADPQGIGSCISYMRRYALASILKLNVDDDDGNHASGLKNKSDNLNESMGLDKEKNRRIFETMEVRISASETTSELSKVGTDIGKQVKDVNDLKWLKDLYKEKLSELGR